MVMALEQAEKLKVSSLAIPALGTGKVGLSVENVASCMSGAFEKFAATNPTYVRQIKVVVFQKNMIKAFRANILLKKEILKRGKREKLLAQTYLKSVTKNEDVEIEIICNSQQLSKTAKEKLQLFMDQNVLRKVVKENLSNMENQDYIDIILKAVDLNVSVIFSEINSEIIVHGLKKAVVEMEAFIEKVMSEAKDARALSKTSLWKWGVPHQHFQLLPLRTSFAIEDNHKKIKDKKFSLPLFGSEIIIDLVSHNFQFLSLSGKLKSINSMSEDLPPEWTAMLGESWLKVSLDPTSYDYKKIKQKFMESKPAIQNLVKIERVQNPALYKQYELKKQHVERCMLSDSPAERKLFHGTTSADDIYKHGFDRGFAGKNATLYGKGTYFHVNSSYSVRYSTVNNPSTKHMFLARVLTGNFCSGNSGLRAAPICPDTNRAFDSVVDDVKAPSIFVVFKDSSAYPSYLITFT
ncbi:protein mono-ADP-ribosyltransferase PARP14-like [Clavelina lepadiformis]|uniref:protein mono-ADP-ribosyltransferase PARP14-like n=1 Tax=Clavelina lepadiformis TaxID=159417 RepID=UPI004041A047